MERPNSIYVSYEVRKALRMWAKAHPMIPGKDSVTADSLADGLLRDAITEQHPQLFEHQKEIAKMEKELIQTLK